VACPFFMPTEKMENGAWMHPSRLPLGCRWNGRCTAPGFEGFAPAEKDLLDFCNLGYADGCGRLPQNRDWDSVRFAARTICDALKNDTRRIQVRYVCERGHRPAGTGFLEFDAATDQWIRPHTDSRIQRMAECFLAVYVENLKNQHVAQSAAS